MAKKRRSPPDDGGGGYSWMDTYGDMVTLLLCFFVLLYSFSSMDSAKAKQLIGAFSGSGSPYVIDAMDAQKVRKSAIDPIDSMVNTKNRKGIKGTGGNSATQTNFDMLYTNIQNYISTNGLESALSVSRSDETIVLRFGEVFLFNSGKADLLPNGQKQLAKIVDIIVQYDSSVKLITIEGNTDNVPIKNKEFSDNWDLSVTRASNVLHTVLAYGTIKPAKLAAVGYGEYHPIDTNYTAAGRARNRRVDFVIQRVAVTTASTGTTASTSSTKSTASTASAKSSDSSSSSTKSSDSSSSSAKTDTAN